MVSVLLRRSLALFAVLVPLFSASTAAAFDWGPRADVIGESFGRALHAAGTIDNTIILAGGGYLGASLWESHNSTVIYDPVSDSWRDGSPMNDLRTAPASAVANLGSEPRLYVFGGMDLTDFPTFHFNHISIEEYDPLLDSWRLVGATMPDVNTWGSCAVTVDNTIYVMGGVDDILSILTDRVVAYDPDADTLTPVATMPMGVSDGACAAVGRRIYWFGGYEDSRGWGTLPINNTFIYDVDTDTWSQSAVTSPSRRANHAAVAIGTTVYVVGGWDGSGTYNGMYNTVDAYDSVLDSWSAEIPSPLDCMPDDGSQVRGRSALSLHLANDGTQDLLYAMGGSVGISIPTRCNEAAPRDDTPPEDHDPPVFAGLATATEIGCDEPSVYLQWEAGVDTQTPPVSYNVYRGDSPSFDPDTTPPVVTGVSELFYSDQLTLADCGLSYWYVVRAQDSAVPPNEDSNTERVQVDLFCPGPVIPANVDNRLHLIKEAAFWPRLDWSTYVPGPEVTHYHVYRALRPDLQGNLMDHVPEMFWIDTGATGAIYFYDLRAATDCHDAESEN
jgi:hypothetical protein